MYFFQNPRHSSKHCTLRQHTIIISKNTNTTNNCFGHSELGNHEVNREKSVPLFCLTSSANLWSCSIFSLTSLTDRNNSFHFNCHMSVKQDDTWSFPFFLWRFIFPQFFFFFFLPNVQVRMYAQGHPMEPMIIPVYPWYSGIQKVSTIQYWRKKKKKKRNLPQILSSGEYEG